jgi:N-formylmaleamate deformylase
MTTLTPEQRRDLSATGACSRWVPRPGRTLHVLDYGGGPLALVIVPGITTVAVAWDFIARELARDVRVVTVDLRGRGLSEGAPMGAAPGASIDMHAEDVLAAVGDLGLERPLVLGHSLGARIAARAALSAGASLGALLLVDPPLSGPAREYPMSAAQFSEQLAESRGPDGEQAAAARYPGWPAAERALRGRWLATCDPEHVLADHRAFEMVEFWPDWRRLPAGTVLAYGAESPVVLAEDAQRLAALNPGATLVSVPAAGHMVAWDAPDGFVAHVRGFLATA